MKQMVAVSEIDAYAIARFAREAGYRYAKEGKIGLLAVAVETQEQFENIARELNRQNSARSEASNARRIEIETVTS